VIEAVAQGKQAARSIDKFLSGKDHFPELRKKNRIRYSMSTPKNEENMDRQRAPRLHVSTHTKGFGEVVHQMEDACAAYEAKRCLRCDIMSLEGKE
jgi:hypothetical protein